MLNTQQKMILVSLSIVSNAVISAPGIEKKNVPLLLPEQNISFAAHEPVEYSVQPPGEFKDVDLPDEIKKQKYIYLASGPENEKSGTELTTKFKNFSIQVAMFKIHANAVRLQQELTNKFLRAEIIEKHNSRGEPHYYVRVGHYTSLQQAQDALDLYNKTANYKALIVKE